MLSNILSKLNCAIRLTLTGLWFCFASSLMFFLLPFRWKDINLDHVFARINYWGAHRILGLRTVIENQSRLYVHQPCIYIGNHQSNLDVFTCSAVYPSKTVVIGKRELAWVPFFGLFFYGAGNVLLNRKDKRQALAGLEAAQKALIETGASVWIYPEGTRNRGSVKMLPFKKGGFYMAIAAQVPIVPFVHQYLRSYFDFERMWLGRGDVLVRVLEPIETKGMTPEDVPRLIEMTRSRMEEAMKDPRLKMPT